MVTYHSKTKVHLTVLIMIPFTSMSPVLNTNKERRECILCNSNYSLKKILIDCVDVADVSQTFYNINTLSDLFTNVEGNTILNYCHFRKFDMLFNKKTNMIISYAYNFVYINLHISVPPLYVPH